MPTPELDLTTAPTMSIVLSAAGKVYDILGWFSPATILVKMLLQSCWKRKLAFQDVLTDELAV